jgi:hypothetical protein
MPVLSIGFPFLLDSKTAVGIIMINAIIIRERSPPSICKKYDENTI